jgi:integrase
MNHNNFYHREYKALLKQAGLAEQGFTFHSLRHTFGTVLFKSGEHPKIVQSLLGHASIVQTIDTYSCRRRIGTRRSERSFTSVSRGRE